MITRAEAGRELDPNIEPLPSSPGTSPLRGGEHDCGGVGRPDPAGELSSLRRLCGRCRGSFTEDHSVPPATLAEWWLCDPCRAALLGPLANVERPR